MITDQSNRHKDSKMRFRLILLALLPVAASVAPAIATDHFSMSRSAR